jgi:gliding motility-associated-like protein
LIIVLNNNVSALTVNFTSSASGTSNTICKNQNLQLFVDADMDFDFWIEYRNTTTGNIWIRLVTTQQSYILGGSSTQVTGDKVNSSDYRIIALDNITVLASLSINVNPLPSVPIANSTTLDYNGAEQTTSDLIPPSGQSISWYTTSIGGTISTKPQGTNAGTYNSYATAIIISTGCFSSLRTLISLTINKVALTVTADPKSKSYDGSVYSGGYTSIISGYLNGEDISVVTGVPSYSGTSQLAVDAGSYVITPVVTGLSATNYSFTAANGALTINKVALTVTADPKSKSYDGNVYGGGYTSTISGYVNSENISVVSGSSTYIGTSILAVNAGVYLITPVVTGLSATNYSFTAANGALTINKVALTVTPVDKSKLYGAAIPALTVAYTGLVNGDVAPTTLPTISTTALASSPAGTYPITASGAADANYTINYVAGTLTVNKVPLTITAVDKTKVYGAVIPVLTIAYTGLVNGDAGPTATISTTALPSPIVGTYPITATGAVDANYAISYLAGTLTVTKAALTITPEDKSKLYGAAMPALTFSYSGLVNGDLAPTTLPAISTTAVLSSAAGTYPISVSTAADANYTINYVAGTLTVNKVPLIITAENKSKVYGAIDPIFTYTYSGLVNGDLATATWPTILTTALPNSTVGIYPIIPSAATDANYTITYVNGSLTVTKAVLTITAKQHTITYNGTAYAGGNGVVPTGLAAGESISNLTGTLIYTGTSQGAKNLGSYTISPDGLSSPNYNINFVGGTLEIKKATLKVIAGDQSVNFGTEIAKILNDAVSTYTGLVGGDNASDITGSVTYSTNYTPLTSTGSSGIYLEPIITGLSSTNYDIIAVKGTITITAPPSSPVFQIPNAFTPNSDGHNDTFKIVQNGYITSIISFRVFTKSGKLIFNDKDGAWDGRYAGVMLDADVYIWIADFINKNNGTEHLSGTVLLLK